MNDFFRRFAQWVSDASGTSWAFILALLSIIVWAVSGPIFNFSETWQLVINTGTTIVTFLMIFLVQNTQNRDAKAMHLKLDALIYTQKRAHNKLMGAEAHSEKQLKKEKEEIEKEKRKK